MLCGFWRDRWNLHSTGFGASQNGIRAQVHDSLVVRSAYRITLPTDVVVSSVKTISKIRWIDLISFDFFLTFIPYHLTLRVLSLLSYLSFLSLWFFNVGWTICAFNLIGSIFGGS